MRTSDTLILSLRTFRTRPMRTALTVLGVGVGIGAVLFLVSLGYGLQDAILDRIASADALLTLDVSSGSDTVPLSRGVTSKIARIDSVDEIARIANVPGQISDERIVSDVQVSVIDPAVFRLGGLEPMEGELFAEKEVQKIVVTSAAAKLFGKEPADFINTQLDLSLAYSSTPEGDDVFPIVRTMTGLYIVSGVIANDNSSAIFLSFDAVHSLDIDRYDQLKVKVTETALLESVRETVIAEGLVVSALSDTIDQVNTIFKIIQVVLALFGALALIVSAIGMFNTMTITLLERTNEIGIMRSIGITQSDVMKMFLVESMLMGLLGGVAGVAIGLLGGEALDIGVAMLARKFGGDPMNIFQVPLLFIGIILAFSAIIGLLTGVYPSVRASRLNPLDALRYK